MSYLDGIEEQATDPYKMPYANAYLIGNSSETTISVIDQYESLAGSFASDGGDLMTGGANGRLTYTGKITKHFHIVSNFDMTSPGTNQTYSFRWFKNGNTPIGPPIERFVGTGSDVGAISLHADAMLAENDYIELKATNKTSTANVTLQNVYLFAMGMPAI